MIEARPLVGFGPGAFSRARIRASRLAGTSRSAATNRGCKSPPNRARPRCCCWLGDLRAGDAQRLARAARGRLGVTRRRVGRFGGDAGSRLLRFAGWSATPDRDNCWLSRWDVLQMPIEANADADEAATARGNLNLGWIGATLLAGARRVLARSRRRRDRTLTTNRSV